MLKRFLASVVFVLTVVFNVWAFGPALQAVLSNSSTGGGGGCDSCTSGLLFSWHGETTDVTTGTPCGCSVGDSTATAVGTPTISTSQYEDGTHSVSISTANYSYSFDWNTSTSPIVTVSDGRVDLWAYWSTITYGTNLFTLTTDADNHINVFNETNNITLNHVAGGTIRHVSSPASSIATGAWYHIIARWYATGSSQYYLQLCVDTTNATTCTAGSYYDALGTWAGTSGTVSIGDIGNNGGVYFVDNVKIYNSGAF